MPVHKAYPPITKQPLAPEELNQGKRLGRVIDRSLAGWYQEILAHRSDSHQNATTAAAKAAHSVRVHQASGARSDARPAPPTTSVVHAHQSPQV